MPEVVQTGASVAIDFLSGFGKGMVQNDINRRENEKLNIQKQKWKAEMTAFAAEDEFRKLQNENSRLEIDMRKTKFADVQATKEQTKGFIGFMADAIGKAKGDPAERQSQLFEAYAQGAAQFTQADRSVGDKLIDMYSKVSQTDSAQKAWKFEDVKDHKTGKKRRALFGESGEIMRYVSDLGNLEVVNDKIAQGVAAHQQDFNNALQSLLAGKTVVLGAEGQSLNLDDFMESIDGDDERTKSEKTVDWIFEVRDRIWSDIEESTGTLDVRLGRMLAPVVSDVKAREELVSPYAKKDYTAGIAEIVTQYPAEDRAAVFARMESDFEAILPEYEMPAVRMELAKLQNKTALELRNKEIEEEELISASKATMSERVTSARKNKEEKLMDEFYQQHGGKPAAQKAKEIGKGILGFRETARDWWDSFLADQPESLFGDKKKAAREYAEERMGVETSDAMETLKLMQ